MTQEEELNFKIKDILANFKLDIQSPLSKTYAYDAAVVRIKNLLSTQIDTAIAEVEGMHSIFASYNAKKDESLISKDLVIKKLNELKGRV